MMNSSAADDVTVPLADWDELKNRATIVLEENEILSNREKELKQSIVDMTTEYHWTTTNQSKEILLLMQDKNWLEEQLLLLNQEKERLEGAVQELLQAYSNLQSRHQEKVKEWNMTYKALQDKYRALLDESQKKVDLKSHKQQLEQMEQTKLNEMKMMTQEMKGLNIKLKETYKERDKLAMRLVKCEGCGTRVKLLESELKDTKMKLSQSLVRAELACGAELIHRKTISQIIKAAERSQVDRETIARIIREEETRKDKLKGAMEYVYHASNLDDFTFAEQREKSDDGDDYVVNFLYNDISSADNDGDNKNDDISGLDDMSYGDIVDYGDNDNDQSDAEDEKKIVTLSENDSLAVGNNGDNKDEENRLTEIRANNITDIRTNDITEIRGTPPLPTSTLNNFLKQQEQELFQMKQMLKVKQAYIDKLKK